MVGRHVGRPCGDHNRGGEGDLLPAARRFVGEGGGGEQCAVRAPQIATMRAGILRPFVESYPCDLPDVLGLNLTPSSTALGSFWVILAGYRQ